MPREAVAARARDGAIEFPPTERAAVFFESAGVGLTRDQVSEVAVWHVDLTVLIVSPANSEAVVLDGAGVVSARGQVS